MDSLEKEFVRRFVLKQKVIYGRSYREIVDLVLERYGLLVSVRTLKRWVSRHHRGWDFRDESRRLGVIHRKVTPDVTLDTVIVGEAPSRHH